MADVRKQMEDTQHSNDLRIKLESKLKHAQENRDSIVKEIQERLKEHVSRSLFCRSILLSLQTN